MAFLFATKTERHDDLSAAPGLLVLVAVNSFELYFALIDTKWLHK